MSDFDNQSAKDGIDREIRNYLAPDVNTEDGEMVTIWLLVAITSSLDGGSATHIVPDRHLPRWQVKGALTHALDVISEGDA